MGRESMPSFQIVLDTSDDAAKAGVNAADLARDLSEIAEVAKADVSKGTAERTLDAGHTVEVVLAILGTNAVTALATGVAVWLKKSRVKIKIGKAEIDLDGAATMNVNVERIVRAINVVLGSDDKTVKAGATDSDAPKTSSSKAPAARKKPAAKPETASKRKAKS